MIKLLFGVFVAVDIAAILFFFVLGLADGAGDSVQDTTNEPGPSSWADRAWRRESGTRGLARDSSIAPAVLMADFDGDGRRDVAWSVRRVSTGERGILIVHANGRAAQQCGAGETFGNGGTNFDWMDHWEVVPHRSGKGAALLVAKAEAASAHIEFRAGRYQWRQRGD